MLFQHTSLTVPLARRVASVAASILPAHVHDQRFRALCLDFKGGDEGVFSLDDDVLRFALQLQSDGELQLDTPGSFQSTTVAPRPQLNSPKLEARLTDFGWGRGHGFWSAGALGSAQESCQLVIGRHRLAVRSGRTAIAVRATHHPAPDRGSRSPPAGSLPHR